MQELKRTDLYSLEEYATQRAEFRARVMAHKNTRRVDLGPHLSLFFEDRLTMQYQVQEMLRTERIFEARGIQEELDAYNPLIPDGGNLKATMMIQYQDEAERREALAGLLGIENHVWIRVGDYPRVRPVCDEDLERSTDDKTSSVHFLRFELDQQMRAAAKEGAALAAGVDHPDYRCELDPLSEIQRLALIADLD